MSLKMSTLSKQFIYHVSYVDKPDEQITDGITEAN
jgi:hypothetical protein